MTASPDEGPDRSLKPLPALLGVLLIAGVGVVAAAVSNLVSLGLAVATYAAAVVVLWRPHPAWRFQAGVRPVEVTFVVNFFDELRRRVATGNR